MFISDRDPANSDDMVDHIYFEMSLSPGSPAVTVTQTGIFGNGRLEARFSVQCSPNFFGGNCLLTSISVHS